MASSWIVKRGEKKGGPFTSGQLKSLANSGQLRRTDLVSRQGENRYVKAEEVKGLFTAPRSNPPATKAPSKTRPAARSKDADYGTVEIIEDFEDEPVVVLEDSNDEFDVADFDDDFGDEDYDEPKPARSRRSGKSTRETPPARSRNGSSRRSSAPAKPAKARKPVKKTSGDEDEDEDDDGPWANLAYGVACLAGGIFLFIALSNGDPNTWESRRGGLILAVLKLMYNIGGKWMVLGLLVCLSGLFFWSAANQLRKR